VKNLLVIVLLLASGMLFINDKKQTADLTRAQDQNDQLTQQLATAQDQNNQLQLKLRALGAQIATEVPSPSHGAYQPPSGASSLEGTNPLDRPAYKDH
jgi:hypothetical protein